MAEFVLIDPFISLGGNDVSDRTWQRGDRTLWRAKNTDTFKPMGPWIVTGLEPDDLHVKITLSGRVVGEYDVSTALFSLRNYISEMRRYLTLYPGDVVFGTAVTSTFTWNTAMRVQGTLLPTPGTPIIPPTHLGAPVGPDPL